jgi:DNA polymerase-4
MELPINPAAPRLLHIDINSCFATATQQAFIHLRGKPLGIAAYETPRAIILAPSMEAKEFGVAVGMRVSDARQLCPHIVIRTPDTGLIRDVHNKFRAVCETFAPTVIPKSIDEMLIDFSDMNHLVPQDLSDVAQELKHRIRSDVGEWIRCSVGIGTNRFLAKLAAGIQKPDGLVLLNVNNLLDAYGSISLLDIPGINMRYKSRLYTAGVTTPLEFFHASSQKLRHQVFKSINGYQWYQRLRGWEVDGIEFKRRTFGQQYSLGNKTNDLVKLQQLLLKLTEKMGRRLRRRGYAARGVHVACWHTDGSHWKASVRSDHAIATTLELYRCGLIALQRRPCKPLVRLLSVHCYDLVVTDVIQEPLIRDIAKTRAVSKALDDINDRYGEYTVTLARMIAMDHTVVDRIAFGTAGIVGR